MADNLKLATIQDLSILNCPLCSYPLTIPAYQCLHSKMVVCSDCWPLKKSICDTCSATNTPSRCKVVENLLEAVRATCPNEDFGCRESIPYINLRKHLEERCRFIPCYCPLVNECDFAGSSACSIYQHYITAHRIDSKNYAFVFGEPKIVLVHESVGVDIMHSKGTSVLFFLEKFKTVEGVYLDLSYVAPFGSNLGPFAYRISRDDFQSEYENPQMKRVNPASIEPPGIRTSLFVPYSSIKSRRFNIVVCIWRVEII